MPTVQKIFGLRVVIYPNDHRPAHVHVIGAEHEAVFILQCPYGPVLVRENYGYSKNELIKIGTELTGNLIVLCARWRSIHGTHC
jgi:hypothetical protein